MDASNLRKIKLLKSFHINEILKIIALEEYLKKNKFSKIITIGLSHETNKVISMISSKNYIVLNKYEIIKNYDYNFSVLNFFKAIIWLIVYLFKEEHYLD